MAWHKLVLIGTILMYAALVLSIYSAFVYYRDYFRNENEREIVSL